MNDTPHKQRAAEKMARIPIKIEPTETPLRKPQWIRAKSPATPEVAHLKAILRENHLHTVCEEAACPNLGECFGKGTATFMIMGDICTRRCTFCDVAHGRPGALDAEEPVNLARTVAAMKLRYVVVTSVDRDDLRDGGAGHFVDCIREIRKLTPDTKIEIGETMDEVLAVMRDLRAHDCDMLTVGQYLQPSKFHLRLERFVHPDEFKMLEVEGYKMGFSHVASGPMVRSSYHADLMAEQVLAEAAG